MDELERWERKLYADKGDLQILDRDTLFINLNIDKGEKAESYLSMIYRI